MTQFEIVARSVSQVGMALTGMLEQIKSQGLPVVSIQLMEELVGTVVANILVLETNKPMQPTNAVEEYEGKSSEQYFAELQDIIRKKIESHKQNGCDCPNCKPIQKPDYKHNIN